MIQSYRDKRTQTMAAGKGAKGLNPQVLGRFRRALAMIDRAGALKDLATPPGNRLHVLTGDRAGQHSISINDQYRVCFVWRDGHAHDVEFTDYH